jgi:FkbM family methyltransferase
MKRFGTHYAGMTYPSTLPGLSSDSIVYCVGAGEDISHDIEVARACGAPVHIFDPTPRAIAHVELVKRVLDKTETPVANKRFGGGDPMYWNRILEHAIPSASVILHKVGVFTRDEPKMRFYLPSNTEYVSYSLMDGMKGTNFISVEVKKLETIMKELGHDRIDFLKLDIEGCECDVIDQMIESQIFSRYLSIDFDLGWTGERIRDQKRCFDTMEKLHENGYKDLYHAEGSAEWSFVREI